MSLPYFTHLFQALRGRYLGLHREVLSRRFC